MYTKAFFTSLLALLAVASPIEKRTAVQIENDLNAVKTDTIVADNAILAFSNTNGTLGEAFSIHTDVIALDNAIKKTITDTEATGPVTDTDATMILKDIQVLEPIITKTLQDTVAKHEGFNRVGSIPVVENDLQNLQSDAHDLESALVSNFPTKSRPQVTQDFGPINSALSSAVATFNN